MKWSRKDWRKARAEFRKGRRTRVEGRVKPWSWIWVSVERSSDFEAAEARRSLFLRMVRRILEKRRGIVSVLPTYDQVRPVVIRRNIDLLEDVIQKHQTKRSSKRFMLIKSDMRDAHVLPLKSSLKEGCASRTKLCRACGENNTRRKPLQSIYSAVPGSSSCVSL